LDIASDTRSLDAAEASIDAFIERRARRGETDPDESEDLWVESVRRFNERARTERRAQWIAYHECMCRLHTQLAGEHAEKAEKLTQDNTEGAA
jgi:hypothetical protein